MKEILSLFVTNINYRINHKKKKLFDSKFNKTFVIPENYTGG